MLFSTGMLVTEPPLPHSLRALPRCSLNTPRPKHPGVLCHHPWRPCGTHYFSITGPSVTILDHWEPSALEAVRQGWENK